MPHPLFVLNGSNLNMLGVREPGLYGTTTLAEIEQRTCQLAESLGLACDFRQTNHEGVLVDWLQEAGRAQAAGEVAGVILNAGAYTHTSVALHDAIKGAGVTLIELHISNVHAREAFRHHSYISPAARAVMAGFGVQGYPLAIAGLAAI